MYGISDPFCDVIQTIYFIRIIGAVGRKDMG